ncbi:MAG TPA: LysR family transcriptional regulator [Actinophytocola sp.]|jgi:molybdate transport repressor ModE-like protein|uniref:LysR family transcriptional regulator n=1 Tax=Actinophytocola sp. TaxID=1872138 RepID=UPI002E09B326|nr:LysR family transcriptional regulator [Actinophytocola sp.]
MRAVLDVRRLLVLRAVARHGSLAAAARELGYSQPAISHHIHRLEAETGVRLIIRDGRGVTLTEAGRALVARADAIATELAAAETQLAAFARTAAGHVRLAALPSSNATLVPAALADLAARGLDITVSLVEAGPDQAFTLLERAECDLAITFDHPTLPAPAGLMTMPLLDDHLFMVLPLTHPLAGDEEIDLARLATEPWIISERCRAQTIHACALAGFTPTVALATDDYQQAVPRLVAAGLGVSLTTACVSRGTRHPDVVLVPVAGIAPRRIIAALPANPRPTAAVSAVLDALQKAASRGESGTDEEIQ